MRSREHLITYLLTVQTQALQEAASLQDPEPEHFALDAVLQELDNMGMVRVPHEHEPH